MSWRTRSRLRTFVRDSIWVVPAVFGILAIVAGLLLANVNARIGIDYSADAARSVLGAIAGGMITFTGFVFSILLLAVQFGSSQFSPRLLGWFLRSATTKIAFGMFCATFIYSLLVLRTVGTASQQAFVPAAGVSVALILLLFSMVMFLRLIHHTTQGLRVASVVARLGRDARTVIVKMYPEPAGTAAVPEPAAPPADARVVTFAGRPGVIQSVDWRGLVAIARDADAVIDLVPPVGDFVSEGVPLFRVHGGTPVDAERLLSSVAIGDERSLDQDPAFGIRLMVDIASKALSPGVNDPGTAIQALDQIELLLRELAPRRITPGVARDAGGRARLRYPAPSWEDYLSLAVDEIRQFGEGSLQVARRLRALLDDLRAMAPTERHAALDAELALLDASVGRAFRDDSDRREAGIGDRQGIGSPHAGQASAIARGR